MNNNLTDEHRETLRRVSNDLREIRNAEKLNLRSTEYHLRRAIEEIREIRRDTIDKITDKIKVTDL